MWERINKLQIQHVVAVIVVLGCFAIAFIAIYKGIPADAKPLIDKLYDVALFGTMGYLYTQSKKQTP